MKLRFLDERNCRALLPTIPGQPVVQLLDDYLQQEVNDKPGNLHGSVEALIRRNKSTVNLSHGYRRLCSANFEVAQRYHAPKREVQIRSVETMSEEPVLLYTVMIYRNGLTWRTVIPLQFLLKGWGDAEHGYQCYVHSVSQKPSETMSSPIDGYENLSDGYHYAGITGRNWLLRLREHTTKIREGSGRKFYQAWLRFLGMTEVYYSSDLKDINLSYKEAMNWEERFVDGLGPKSLNMIPGGFKGLRHLHEHRITDRISIPLEERDRAIAEYVRQHPRKGIPNPFISELWQDDEFYLKVIKARPKTLSPGQVRRIRELAEKGRPVPEIAAEVGARNEPQVRNVISGRYYKRIK
jgi:hypothetical protein